MDNTDPPPSPPRVTQETHPGVDMDSIPETAEIVGHGVSNGEPYYIFRGTRWLPQDQLPPRVVREYWQNRAPGYQPPNVPTSNQPPKPNDN